MKVFLDVGAHTGQTLAAVLHASLNFDRIVCFEPVPANWPALMALQEARTRIEHFGLWNCTGRFPVMGPGRQGAGLWLKDSRTKADGEQPCNFVRASDWFRRHVRNDDTVYLKLNCEGAECDIVDDLIDSGEFAKVAHVMIDFDVRKVSALKHREAETRARLAAYPFPRVAFSKNVMKGDTHQLRIRNWLRLVDEA